MSLNLICKIPYPEDATSFYRAVYPISKLRKILPELNIFHADKDVNLLNLAHMDVFFMQRPHTPDFVEAIRLCKILGIKVWLDYDDDLLSVPPNNPSYSTFGKKETKTTLIEILRTADIVSVSTDEIKETFERAAPSQKFVVIPNAYNDYFLPDNPKKERRNLVFWRGSETHQRDLSEYAEPIVQVAKQKTEFVFNFMGYQPWFIESEIKNNFLYTHPLDLFSYIETLKNLRSKVCIVPLHDDDFNRAKSNIAWIEATWSGSVTLAPDWTEWRKPGITNYKNKGDFRVKLIDLLNRTDDEISELNNQSMQYISENLVLSKVNHKRKELLKYLLGE